MILVSLTLLPLVSARAFEGETHRNLTLRALDSALNSDLDSWLKDGIGLVAGGATVIPADPGVLGNRDQTVSQIAAQGSVDEDWPHNRVLNHFHDPTMTWDSAGIRPPLFGGESSAKWAQEILQNPLYGRSFSWHDARAYFYEALTGDTETARNRAWGLTFTALGHVVHLVQDLASPAHTRNDWHFPLLGQDQIGSVDIVDALRGDSFHRWAKRQPNAASILSLPQQKFAPAVLNKPVNPLVPIPFAGAFDTEGYRASLLLVPPPVPPTGLASGLAEYSNGNFYSDNTVGDYIYPKQSELDVAIETDPDTDNERRYYKFRSLGSDEPSGLAGTPSALYRESCEGCVLLRDVDVGLDDNVLANYGRLLLPRAVGYSAGVLEYFFRGRLEVRPDPQLVLRQALPYQDQESLKTVTLSIRNSGTDYLTGGTVLAVVEYRTVSTTSPTPETLSSSYWTAEAANPVVLPRDSATFFDVKFDFNTTPLPPVPASTSDTHTEVIIYAVYRGAMQAPDPAQSSVVSEADGIAVGNFPISFGDYQGQRTVFTSFTVTPPDRGYYALAIQKAGSSQPAFDKLRIAVRGSLAGGLDVQQGGEIAAVYAYREAANASDDLAQNPYVDLTKPRFAISPFMPFSPSQDFELVDFDLTDSPGPVVAADAFIGVVYRGPLDGQQNVVGLAAGVPGDGNRGMRKISEPTEVHWAHSADYYCANYDQSNLVYVGGATCSAPALLYGTQPLYPTWFQPVYLKVTPVAVSLEDLSNGIIPVLPVVSRSDYDVEIPSIEYFYGGSGVARVFLLHEGSIILSSHEFTQVACDTTYGTVDSGQYVLLNKTASR